MDVISSGSLRGLNILFGEEIVVEVVDLIALSESFALGGGQLVHHLHLKLLAHLIFVGEGRGSLRLRVLSTLE